MEAFATVADFVARTRKVLTEPEQEWITTLLEDASTYLRDDVIGYQIYPQATATITTNPDSSGELVLGQQPIIEVTSVVRDGEVIDWKYRDGSVFVLDSNTDPITVTFTYGYATAPESLKRWSCVLVSQVLLPLEQNLGLSVGGLSSIQIDDFRMAFADGGEHTGMQLSERAEKSIRAQFRSTAAIVGLR